MAPDPLPNAWGWDEEGAGAGAEKSRSSRPPLEGLGVGVEEEEEGGGLWISKREDPLGAAAEGEGVEEGKNEVALAFPPLVGAAAKKSSWPGAP